MGANAGFKAHIQRFLKSPDHMRGTKHGLGDGRGMCGVSPEIAFAFFRGRKQGSVAAEVQNDITFRNRAVLRGTELHRTAPTDNDLLQGVELDGKPAQRPGRTAD